MSTAVHHFGPPFDNYQSSFGMLPQNAHFAPQPLHAPGPEAFSHAPQYAVQPIHHSSMNSDLSSRKRSISSRYGPYGNGTLGSTMGSSHRSLSEAHNVGPLGGSAPVRRRISRACDQCNQLRTRCDGQSPCAHCVELGLTCEYNRERKKRGKASRKDIQQQQQAAAAAAASASNSQSPNGASSQSQSPSESFQAFSKTPEIPPVQGLPTPALSSTRSMSVGGPHRMPENGLFTNFQRAGSMSAVEGHSLSPSFSQPGQHHQMSGAERSPLSAGSHLHMSPMEPMPPTLRLNVFEDHQSYTPSFHDDEGIQVMSATSDSAQMNASHGVPVHSQAYMDQSYAMISPHTQEGTGFQPQLNGFLEPAPSAEPGAWMSMAPAPPSMVQPSIQEPSKPTLRYPVLDQLLPYIESFVPGGLACDLLDLYFASSSSVYMQPLSPFVLGHLFRQQSFLHPQAPRASSPALVASMLWLAAQTSDAPALTSSATARSSICKRLLETTISLLGPLVYNSSNAADADVSDSAAIVQGQGSTAAGSLDDVVTYIHLATVTSSSGMKPTSLRWWSAAFTLACELGLNKETASSSQGHDDSRDDADDEQDEEEDAEGELDTSLTLQSHSRLSEETREERRRTWWLLYALDRHLSLTFSRPLALLDADCAGLLQPLDENIWQSASFPQHCSSRRHRHRQRGPSTAFAGCGFFGGVLPLMSILGQVISLAELQLHPRLGALVDAQMSERLRETVRAQLESYDRGRAEFEQLAAAQDHESVVCAAYMAFISHTLHVLLLTPPHLLTGSTSNPESDITQAALQHAILAADALGRVQDRDGRLSYLGFFTGTYVQRCLLVLLAAAEAEAQGNTQQQQQQPARLAEGVQRLLMAREKVGGVLVATPPPAAANSRPCYSRRCTTNKAFTERQEREEGLFHQSTTTASALGLQFPGSSPPEAAFRLTKRVMEK
ncbi:MAG: hypothetical protein M1824_001587 [Vezdaea acicularis]|nr:MAG: hypothetical protein M1824_001587 [Vezdaea acicularis]